MSCLKDMTLEELDGLTLPGRKLFVVYKGEIIKLNKFDWIKSYCQYKTGGYAGKFKALIFDTYTTLPEAETKLKELRK